MRKTTYLFLIVLSFSLTFCENFNPNDAVEDEPIKSVREFYQLKVYSFKSDIQVKATDKFLKEAYLPGLKKLGINNIGVFKLKPNDRDTIQKTFVLIPFTRINQFIALEDSLSKDEQYLKAGSDYIDASYDEPPYDRIESILLKAFSDMPIMQTPTLDGPKKERIYELRSYESSTEQYYKNKVEMFNEGGEVKLFDRLGFNAVFYGEVISGSKMPNLMYMTTFSNQTSRDEHWKAFAESPEWKALTGIDKYKNNVSHIDISFLYPTDYSDY